MPSEPIVMDRTPRDMPVVILYHVSSTFICVHPWPAASSENPMKTARTKKLPLFYTHVIGSLPRPKMVRDLLDRKGKMSPKDYNAALDDVVRFAIRLQEQAGLDVISDGEWRR